MLSVEMLPANEGDCLWVEYGNPQAPSRVVIDCGYRSTYRELLRRLDADRGVKLELLVLSHIDADHIAGAPPFIADSRVTPDRVGEVWFNSRQHLSDKLGVEQALYFTHFLVDKRIPWNTRFANAVVADTPETAVTLAGGMRMTLLSPRREQLRELALHWDDELESILLQRQVDSIEEILATTPKRLQPDTLGTPSVRALADSPFEADTTAPNGSSIAFLAEYQDVFDGNRVKTVLFGADAFAPVLSEAIASLLKSRGAERLPLDAFKVAHHGSKHNTSKDLLALLDCRHFLFSTNGSKHEHPDPECIARVVTSQRHEVDLHFNYDTRFNSGWRSIGLEREFRYRPHYPAANQQGYLRLSL